MDMITKDRIKGMFEGLALGDALGVPHEFRYNRNIAYTGVIEYRPRYISRFQGTRYTEIGQCSDDTEMTLILARSLLKNKGYKKDDIILDYEQWANSTFMLGKNTRALFCGVKTVAGYQKRYDKIFSNDTDKWTQSNGSLMRCSPLALLSGYNEVIEDCKLTNPHPVNLDANIIYITTLRYLLQGYNISEIYPLIKDNVQTEPVREVLKQAENATFRDVNEKEVKGWVVNALYCAMMSITHFDNYKDAIDWVIRLGGDTDTNAAIAGALLGAKHGHTGLISNPITERNLEKVLKCDTSKSDLYRPPEYTLYDIDDLVEGLYDVFVTK